MPTITYLPQAITDGSGLSGVVHSVALSLPAIMTVSGSPVTNTGTLTGTLASQSANRIWAGPTSGGASAPTFRSLVTADIPRILTTITRINMIGADDGNPIIKINGSDGGTDDLILCRNFDDDADFFKVAYTGLLTATSAFTITSSSASFIPLTVKGHATQSANLQEWKNTSDTVVASISNAGVITGVGSGLTTLNASNISSGTLDNARLASTVVLENTANAFTVGGHTITNNSDVTSLVLKGNATQTSVLFTIQRSNATPIFNIYNSGYAEIIARQSVTDVLLVSGDAQTVSGNLLNVTDGAGAKFGVGPTGQIQTTTGSSGVSTPGNVVYKLPIYDDNNNLIGYAALYDDIT